MAPELHRAPRFSVIIPVYNGAKYIARTLDSVFGQTYPAHEVIVIDDGSTDGTAGILDGFGSRIIRRRTQNAGVSAARNQGAGLATGDWVSFLDHDDLWFKNMLQRMADAIGRLPEEVGLVCCNLIVRYAYRGKRLVRHFDILRNLKQMNFDGPLEKDPLEMLIKENFISAPAAVVVKKALVDRLRWDTRYRYAQDFDYWAHCALHTKFAVLSEVLVYKRTHETNISNDEIATWSEHARILKDLRGELRGGAVSGRVPSAIRRRLADIDYYLGNIYFEKGRVREAFARYGRALFTEASFDNTLRFATVTAKKSVRFLLGRTGRSAAMVIWAVC